MSKKGNQQLFFRFVLTTIIFCTAVIIFIAISIYQYSLKTQDVKADAAIVLGAAVWKSNPSPIFKERINHAINLYNNKNVNFLIFTGGVGDGDELAESEVAKTYAIDNGVQENIIFIETSSKLTSENLIEAKKIMKDLEVNSVLLVSDPLHMKRAMAMAKGLEIDAYSSPTPTSRYKSWHSKLKFLLSETCYYFGYLAKKYVTTLRV